MLNKMCEEAGTGSPSLENVIRTMAQPLFELHRSSEIGGRSFIQILARGLTEPLDLTARLLAEEYHPVIARFGQLIRRQVPQLSPEEFMWRLSFIVGALHHTLATLHQMTILTRGICRSDDYDVSLTRFIAHAVAAFQTP